MSDSKRVNGQYFTTTSPFETIAFKKWFNTIPESIRNTTILEPFAGGNNIPALIKKSAIQNDWKCYDIEPATHNVCPEYPIEQQDTIKNFPVGFDITITNPPYLGKNSATRRGLRFPNCNYDDLYKFCLEKILLNSKYVAVIIPETFIISNLFTDRLAAVISLTCKMFNDTDCPVCLALFNPDITDNFEIYKMNTYLGTNISLSKFKVIPFFNHTWTINDPNGEIGIICIDDNNSPTIRFCLGTEIDSNKIKNTSRSFTRVSGLPNNVDIMLFINKCNELLNNYRLQTFDVFMAAFKNLRKDNCYRRRLDFATAKQIMSKALEEF